LEQKNLSVEKIGERSKKSWNPWNPRQNKGCKETQEPKSVKKTRGVSQKIFDGGICNIYYPHPQHAYPPAEIKNPRPGGGGIKKHPPKRVQN